MTPTTGSATVFNMPYCELTEPARRVGVLMDGVGVNAAHTGRRHLQICAKPRVSRRHVSTRSWIWWRSVTPRIAPCGTGRAACASGSHWLPLCSATRSFWCWTSRPMASTPTACAGFARSCRAFAAEGRTVLVSSHILAEIEQTVDDVVVLQRNLRFVVHCRN